MAAPENFTAERQLIHPIRRVIIAGAALLGSLGVQFDSSPVNAVTGTESVQEVPAPAAGSLTEFTLPANETSIVNMTVTQTVSGGYYQILGEGSTIGSSSNLNASFANQTVAGMAFAKPANLDGKMQVYSQSGGHIIIDRAGSLAAGAFDDVPDIRLLDTRHNGSPLPANGITELNARPNSTAVINFVATDVLNGGYIQVLSSPTQVPGEYSNLNATPGYTTAKLAMVHFDENGKAWVYNQARTAIIADLQGYFNADAIIDIKDARILDTRSTGNMVADGSLTKINGKPNSTGVISLVALGAKSPGFVQIVNKGDTVGATSNVNTDTNSVAGNLAFVNFDENGEAQIYSNVATHLVVDLQAYFADGKFIPVKPAERVIDTRLRAAAKNLITFLSMPESYPEFTKDKLSLKCFITQKLGITNQLVPSREIDVIISGLKPRWTENDPWSGTQVWTRPIDYNDPNNNFETLGFANTLGTATVKNGLNLYNVPKSVYERFNGIIKISIQDPVNSSNAHFDNFEIEVTDLDCPG